MWLPNLSATTLPRNVLKSRSVLYVMLYRSVTSIDLLSRWLELTVQFSYVMLCKHDAHHALVVIEDDAAAVRKANGDVAAPLGERVMLLGLINSCCRK